MLFPEARCPDVDGLLRGDCGARGVRTLDQVLDETPSSVSELKSWKQKTQMRFGSYLPEIERGRRSYRSGQPFSRDTQRLGSLFVFVEGFDEVWVRPSAPKRFLTLQLPIDSDSPQAFCHSLIVLHPALDHVQNRFRRHGVRKHREALSAECTHPRSSSRVGKSIGIQSNPVLN